MQILRILKLKSVWGLSVVAFELEVVGYTIALAYCLHKGLPFSAYGELAFLLIQGKVYYFFFSVILHVTEKFFLLWYKKSRKSCWPLQKDIESRMHVCLFDCQLCLIINMSLIHAGKNCFSQTCYAVGIQILELNCL